MKLYDFKMAPNPQRVNMFIAEKGIKIPTVEINTRERAQFADSFKLVNPISQVPVLELDDGTCISENMAICRYLEELHPEPSLFGHEATKKSDGRNVEPARRVHGLPLRGRHAAQLITDF